MSNCILDCSAINNTFSNNGANSCSCISQYFWNLGACKLNCSSILFTNGNLNLVACKCLTNYEWVPNGIVGSCLINCSKVTNAITQSSLTITCTCVSKYIWDQANTACKIDCPNTEFSNGTNNGSDACHCKVNYTWNGSSCILNCSNISNTTGFSLLPSAC